MARKPANHSSSLPLDVFRSQIKQFKRAHIIPLFDGMFEKDAIISALRRIDSSLPTDDANLHAGIIIQNHMVSPNVSTEDIAYALSEMRKRNGSIRYQCMYAVKQLMVLLPSKTHSHGMSYWKRFMRIYHLGTVSRQVSHRQTYSTSFGHAT